VHVQVVEAWRLGRYEYRVFVMVCDKMLDVENWDGEIGCREDECRGL
jgi:hypothetical protein